MTQPLPPRRNADPSDATGGDPTPPSADTPVGDADAAALQEAAASLADLADAVSATAGGSSSSGRAPNVISGGGDRPTGGTPEQFKMPSFDAAPAPLAVKAIDLLSNVNLNVKIELGRTRMLVSDVLKLGEGSVVELDKLAGDPVDIYVNDRPIARGEVLVLNENFCVRINEILSQEAEPGATPG